MPEKEQTLLTAFAAAYFKAINRLSVSFKRGLIGKRGVTCKRFPGLVASFGCEGDKHAPIAYIDGSYRLRDRKNAFVTFGITDIDSDISWYNKEGWLPCFVSEFKKDGVDYRIESFADRVDIGGNAFEAVYSRVTVFNGSGRNVPVPKASKMLVPLNAQPKSVEAGKKTVLDFAVCADRFGGHYKYPSKSEVAAQGGFDAHYERMKNYWIKRLEPLCEISALPDEKLINAYKAGYVYTMIVKDGFELHVGENGYDRVFDHDVIGIMIYLITMGDFSYFKEYSKYILQNVQYPDARWKYSMPFAYYLFKTGDEEFVKSKFSELEENAHRIEKDIDAKTGIMIKTMAIDSLGNWTIDNWSALTGLCCYEYICRRLGFEDEAKWANAVYGRLLKNANDFVGETIKRKGLDYLPISMSESNEEGKRSNPKDANWASMFLFGRWGWDGWLFCAEQSGIMIDLIDKTYEHGFKRREEVSDSIYNFGGYPHGYYCSAYNAGYGATALRGEKYRDCAIKAYQFMINNAMSGPFSWWEGIGYPDSASPWNIPHAAEGGGSCPHIWGQSTAGKALLDSLVCQRINGDIIIGRGVPKEWLVQGEKIEVKKYPIENGGRIDILISIEKEAINIKISGDRPSGNIIADLPDVGLEIRTEEYFK